MTERPPISAYIRSRNEARVIADVVRPALAAADEVVVVDSKSIDFLEAIPRNPTGKILKRVLREPYWKGKTRRVN